MGKGGGGDFACCHANSVCWGMDRRHCRIRVRRENSRSISVSFGRFPARRVDRHGVHARTISPVVNFMERLIIANWKMNPRIPKAAFILAGSVKRYLKDIRGVRVVICPPFPYLAVVARQLKHSSFYLPAGNAAPWGWERKTQAGNHRVPIRGNFLFRCSKCWAVDSSFWGILSSECNRGEPMPW